MGMCVYIGHGWFSIKVIRGSVVLLYNGAQN